MNRVRLFAPAALLAVLPVSAAQLINVSPAITSGDVDEFAISPDGTQIAFVGSIDDGSGTDQLYIVPIGGGTATRINPDGVGDIDGGVIWTPDGTGVIARYGGGDGNQDNQMYLMPANGAKTAIQLTFNTTNDFDQQINPAGTVLYYVDSKDLSNQGGLNSDDLLYGIAISDGLTIPTPFLITPDNTAEIDTGGYAQVGSDIVYAGSLPGEGETRFYRTAADGTGTPAEITVTGFNSFTDIDEMAVTPDGQTIIFVADQTTDGVDELYSMPIAGGAATQLLPNIQTFTDVGPFVISPDGTTIAFQADYDANGVGEAYVIPIAGGDPIQVSDDLTGVGFNADVVAGVGRIAFTPDSSQIIYLADGRTNGINEMYITDNPIPEPGSLALLGLGGLLIARRRR